MGGNTLARLAQRLSTLAVRRFTTPGDYCDGENLFLRISPGGSKSWVFQYRFRGSVRHEMGLGGLSRVSLSEARQIAAQYRSLLAKGIDPLTQRRAEQIAQAAEAARAITFQQAATRFIAANRSAWRSERHAAQWQAT